MEPEFEMPELSLRGAERAPRTVRIRAEAALRAGLDAARCYHPVDPPAGAARVLPDAGVWIDDGDRPRLIPVDILERRAAPRSGRP